MARLAAAGRVEMGQPGVLELALEPHVHDERVRLLRPGMVQPRLGLAERGIVVHLYLLHRVGRQVAQGHLRVAREELAAAHEQPADELAVVGDASALADAHAGQGLDQAGEHVAVRHLQGVGVVLDGVALHHHEDARGPHHGLAQLVDAAAEEVHVDVPLAGGHLDELPCRDVHPQLLRLVGGQLHAHQIGRPGTRA